MISRSTKLFYTLFFTLILVLIGIFMAHEIKQGDYPQHINWAREYAEISYFYRIPHTLFAKLVVIIRALLPANILVRVSALAKQVFDLKSFEISAWILMELSYIATAFILVKSFIKNWSGLRIKSLYWVVGLATLIILFASPIFLFTIPDRLFLGYISPNPYQSPTYILLKPFVLMVFIGICNNLFEKWNWQQGIIVTFMIVCASLAKPSFTLTLLPAGGLLILFFYLKELKKLNWLFVLGPIGLTSIIMLISGFIVNYSGDRGERILFEPFAAMLTQAPNIILIFVFLFLSITFPLLVIIFYWKKIWTILQIRLGWINFLVSLFYLYFFAEKYNLTSNNFVWGSMIGLFLLFFVSITEWVKILFSPEPGKFQITWREILVGSSLLLHTTCGIIYFWVCLTSVGPLVK